MDTTSATLGIRTHLLRAFAISKWLPEYFRKRIDVVSKDTMLLTFVSRPASIGLTLLAN